ncbi:major tail protein [Staphylococcus xylosus]|uniref:major tail protein n=1 Tax=Staphylococcus xylosus TaxID=1288 RepID=UPI001C3EDF7C|nr:major tail protein [Staphylococcus xylosus]
MSKTVGFKQIYVGVFDQEGKTLKNLFLWKDEKGGTVNMNVSGLAPENIEMRASNKTVWQKKKGAGEVKSELGLFNIPTEHLNIVLGRDTDTNGSSWVGDDTSAPYVAMIGESEHLLTSEPIYCGLVKGTLSLDSDEWKTTQKQAEAPEPTTLNGDWIARDIDGKSRIVGYHEGENNSDKFFEAVLPGFSKLKANEDIVNVTEDEEGTP